jgi:hypothetical protein
MRKLLFLALLLGSIFASCSSDDDIDDDGQSSKTYMKGSFGGTAFEFPDASYSYSGGYLSMGGQFNSRPDSHRIQIEVTTQNLNGAFPCGDKFEEDVAFMIFSTPDGSYYSEYVDCTGGVSVPKYAGGTLKTRKDGNYLLGEYAGTFYMTTSCLINDRKDLRFTFRVKMTE